MIKLGLDFDNTLIDYDEVFYNIALEKDLIPDDIDKTKSSVRNYLKEIDKEDEFTLMQGEVYGLKINLAKQSEGMFETLKTIRAKGIELIIVSHKTLYPYAGPQYNLHKSASSWLIQNKFFDHNEIGIKKENVYFETTKESKVKRIEDLGITHYIDDLTKILEMINPRVTRIHYNPKGEKYGLNNIYHLNSWHKLPIILDDLTLYA